MVDIIGCTVPRQLPMATTVVVAEGDDAKAVTSSPRKATPPLRPETCFCLQYAVVVGYCEGCGDPLERCSRCGFRLTWYCGCEGNPTYPPTEADAGEAVSCGQHPGDSALQTGRIMPAVGWQGVWAKGGESANSVTDGQAGGQLGREWRAGAAWFAEGARTAIETAASAGRYQAVFLATPCESYSEARRLLVRLRGGTGGDTPYGGEEDGPEDVPAMAPAASNVEQANDQRSIGEIVAWPTALDIVQGTNAVQAAVAHLAHAAFREAQGVDFQPGLEEGEVDEYGRPEYEASGSSQEQPMTAPGPATEEMLRVSGSGVLAVSSPGPTATGISADGRLVTHACVTEEGLQRFASMRIHDLVLQALYCYSFAGHPVPNIFTRAGNMRDPYSPNGSAGRVSMFIWRETSPERTMPRAGLRGSAISVAQSALQIAVEVHGAAIVEEVLLWALVARGSGGAQIPTSFEVHLSPPPPLSPPQAARWQKHRPGRHELARLIRSLHYTCMAHTRLSPAPPRSL